MSTLTFSTDQLDYLQRTGASPVPIPSGTRFTVASPARRRLVRVAGRGRPPEPRRVDEQQPRLGSEGVLAGLYGYRLPLALRLDGGAEGVALHVGTWSPDGREALGPETLDSRLEALSSLLVGSYPGVALEPAVDRPWPRRIAGLVLGVPTPQPPEEGDGAMQLDRLFRAVQGSGWSVLVLAQPVDEGFLQGVRHSLLNEARSSQGGAMAAGAPSPLTEHYVQMIQTTLESLTLGQAEGCWRTAVYLTGDDDGYHRLASVWAGVFGGMRSLPEAIRVVDQADAARLGADWAMPDTPGAEPPGAYRHPFEYQTLLTTRQLASYVHLPAVETRGFRVSLVPKFDVATSTRPGEDGLEVGHVVEHSRPTSSPYSVPTRDLNRHALIAGVTGAGKTHTTHHLLGQLWDRGVPFLVIEPAKTEYRRLLDHPRIGPDLQVFTLGDEATSPFRMNPFEVEPGIGVLSHIDLLKSVFNASFGLFNPLPQVLERCLHEVYEDFGWDTVHNANARLEHPDRAHELRRMRPFPTLGDLYAKVEDVVNALGYHERITSDIKAALMTRLNSLRIGAKGAMLDAPASIPMARLLERPTVIELDHIGDDDERAFLMGLLLIRLYEHRRAHGTFGGDPLRHVVVIEEAHRLLANVSRSKDPEVGDPRGKAVETFANMLSEVRAYGEGFVVVEQIPGKLAPDVIKNSNLKIVHRIVAGDDRQTLGTTMNMDDGQFEALATLGRGRAAVFAEGDDRPVLVQVPPPGPADTEGPALKADSDLQVAEAMGPTRRDPSLAAAFRTREGLEMSPAVARWQRAAATLVERRDVQDRVAAFTLGLAVRPESAGTSARDLLAFLRARLDAPDADTDALEVVVPHAVLWACHHFGRRYRWSYERSDALAGSLTAVLAGALHGEADEEVAGPAGAFSDSYVAAGRRHHDPFRVCAVACPDATCRFRFHARRALDDRRLLPLFEQGLTAAGLDDDWDPLADAVSQTADRLGLETADQGSRIAAGLCFTSQLVDRRPELTEAAREMILDRVAAPTGPEPPAAQSAGLVGGAE